MKQWRIKPTDGGEPYIVSAETYKYETATGRHIFTNTGGVTVANLLNVSVADEAAIALAQPPAGA